MLSETALVLHYMLYAMPRHLRIGQTAGEVRKGGGLLELSEGARLQQANLEVVQSFGANLLEVLAGYATTGAELLLQAGLMARLAELSLLSLRPDLDAALLQQSGEGGALQRYHAVQSQSQIVMHCRVKLF